MPFIPAKMCKIFRFTPDYIDRKMFVDLNLRKTQVNSLVQCIFLFDKFPSYLHDDFQKLSSVQSYQIKNSSSNFMFIKFIIEWMPVLFITIVQTF
jgi:hypothetical protein